MVNVPACGRLGRILWRSFDVIQDLITRGLMQDLSRRAGFLLGVVEII